MEDTKICKENLQWLLEQPVDIQYELFRNHVNLAKMHYNQLVEEETQEKAGKKNERGKAYSRWGSNPGSIRIGSEKVPVAVQRLYNKAEDRTEEVEYYQRLHALPMPTEDVMKK
jgi:hypothetical protein